MTVAPYMSILVQLDTPDAPKLDGRPVHTVSWGAIRYDERPVEYTVYAHHPDRAHALTTLTRGVDLPAILADLPAWVPRPPSGWLASLRMTAEPDPDHKIRAYLAQEGSCRTVEVTGGIIPDPHTLFAGGVW